MKKRNSGQTTAEYFILTAVILAALLATGFLGHVKDSFQAYCAQSVAVIAVNR